MRLTLELSNFKHAALFEHPTQQVKETSESDDERGVRLDAKCFKLFNFLTFQFKSHRTAAVVQTLSDRTPLASN